jgi:hypothetical protein
VRLPSIEQGEPNPREVHEENLRICDAVLIYYGSSREAWLHSKLADLRKVRGYGRSTPIAVRAIYLAPPDCSEKQNLRTHDAMIIHPSQAFDPAALAPFIEALKAA